MDCHWWQDSLKDGEQNFLYPLLVIQKGENFFLNVALLQKSTIQI